MELRLSEGLHHAVADGRAIFLDVDGDRYFCLPPDLDEAFRAFAGNAPTKDVDRARLSRLVQRGILVEGHAQETAPVRSPCRSAMEESALRADWVSTGTIIAAVMCERLRLRTQPLASIFDALRNIPLPASAAFDQADLLKLGCALKRAQLIARSRDRCLPQSIAVARHLRRRSIPAILVIGVSGRPFAAHSWVQVEDMVINDTIEHASGFTPILSL